MSTADSSTEPLPDAATDGAFMPDGWVAPTEAPDGTPADFTVSSIRDASAEAAWSDNSSNEESFVIERWDGETSSWVEHATTAANVTSVALTGLVADTEYGMRVRARNLLGDSDPSNEEWFTTTMSGAAVCGDGTCGGGETCSDCASDCGACGACPPGFRAMVARDQGGDALGDSFLDWRRSVVDDTYSVSHGRGVRVRTDPGAELLPACGGAKFYAGRTRLPEDVPPGSTIWFRVYQYIPSEFSFGYKYSSGDRDEARACSQPSDGNSRVKWLVLAPSDGTARIYFSPGSARRALRSSRPRLRIISEAAHVPGDFDVELPRDRWFSLQVAVRVSSGDDGFMRVWLDDEFLGEVLGPTTVAGASMREWGIGDYWNGVPWTDGRPGRTDFWVDEVIVASDAPGYGAPTGVDGGGRAYIPSCMRVADLSE